MSANDPKPTCGLLATERVAAGEMPASASIGESSHGGAPMDIAPPKVVCPNDGKAGFLGSIGVRFMIDGVETASRFSLVEHPMSARALAAPLHKHAREDEYSYVLEGSVGALLGDSVIIGKAGDLIFKPRNQWHTFWNAGNTPARILEIISPAGFEKFFEEQVDLGGVTKVPPQVLAQLCARYELQIDFDSIPGLVERFGLQFPAEPVQ
jgi:quercetin dioxygenase-like cupin family protein